MKIAFLGLGAMGFPMAGHLSQHHAVTVYNRTDKKAHDWMAQYPGAVANTPKEAAGGADVIFLCVGDDPDVCSVLLGEEGALAGTRKGAVVVDHTTTSPGLAVEMSKACHAQGVTYLDAPVSGGEEGAKRGTLTMMVGGDQRSFESVHPVLSIYAKQCVWMGDSGHGQLTKLMNQICLSGALQGLSEGISFGQKTGIDVEKALSVMVHGAAGSWQMKHRGDTMLKGEYGFGFAVDWMRKDLRHCFSAAQLCGAELPVTQMVDTFFAQLQEKGMGRSDTSSLLCCLNHVEAKAST